MKDILFLERLAMRAWPAIESEEAGGWLLRAAGGCTKRANSVNALQPEAGFDIVERADRFYRARSLPTVFRITPLAPAQSDAELERRGFVLREPSVVMSTRLPGESIPGNVDIREEIDAEWLTGVAEANGVARELRAQYEAILRAIPGRIGCATLVGNGRSLGFALGVVEEEMLGLFNLVVVPRSRGRGYGRALVQALSGWARTVGATGAYLQVHAANEVAVGLYESLGFMPAYRYHYRLRNTGV